MIYTIEIVCEYGSDSVYIYTTIICLKFKEKGVYIK